MRAGIIDVLPWLKSIRPALTLVDPVAVVAAALLVRGSVSPVSTAAAALAAVLVCRGSDLHRSRLVLSAVEDLPRLALAAATAGLTVAALTSADLRSLLVFTTAALLLLVVLRSGVYALAHARRRSGRSSHPVIVVGAGPVGQRLVTTFLHRPELGLHPVGIIDTSSDLTSRDLPVPLLGTTAGLENAMQDLGVDDVVFAFPEPPDDELTAVVRRCVQADHQVFVVPRFFEMMGVDHHRRTEVIGDVAVMRLRRWGLQPHAMLLKRTVDIVLSGIALVLLTPVLLACALAVRVETGPGVIFRQTRIGLGGRPFVLFKFRSLKPLDTTESQTQWSIDNDHRVGPVGRLLRRTSLDELPQLVNVLRGDMSLVGPRPERPFFVREFSRATVRYDERHRVQTGLTGWAQVHDLRGDTSIDARVRFDNHYIENWSLWTDLKIMARTVLAIVRHQPDTRAPILHRPEEPTAPPPSAPTRAVEPDAPHVLHVSMPTTEGVANVLMGYVRDQVARGWSVTVACPSAGWLGEAARASGADVVRWEATRSPGPGLVREIRRLRRIVNDSRPDVVHLHSAKAGMVGRLLLRGVVPTIFQPHAWSFQAVSGPMRRATTAWERFAQRWTTELVCVSRSERAVAESVGISTATTISPNGVDLDRFDPDARLERTHARRRLGLTDVPTVVCVGRLAEQKGQQDLLDAWDGVRDRVPDAHLVLVGDGPDRHVLEARTAELPDVDLVGVRSDVDTWLAAADVIAVPSHWEGMAVAPLEAMASGRSVVATDVEGMAESVPRGGGLIVEIGDVDALADGIADRLLDPGLADREGAVGQRHVTAHHDANASARDVARLTLRQYHRGRGTADVLMALEPMPLTQPRRRRGGASAVAVPADREH
ncbi:exopolysaccharide biosynthesis polyprenyl glycosylphosphotransferase [Nocardioides sp. URHA0020]|uniref:exopolysaccharide biosynthesis polyprenyl glycosylphosphotransferase n=1 Tax=Nocardioides sp. URHA0020 TaxID=1380392 RepID=UPI0006884A7F|nr:exopolysaccharide biosynthesis polyprenyl glycosylphosphotransferase [Nocardioides sp. URHA0020]